MHMMQFSSIRHEILFFGAISLIIISAAVIGYASLSQYGLSVEQSKTMLSAVAGEKATILKDDIDEAFIIDRTLAHAIRGALDTGNKPSREEFQAIIFGLMKAYPQYNGIYLALEPNVYDGKDREYQGKAGTDSSGRFMAYYSRDSSGNPKLDYIYNYNPGEEGNEYYQIPKTTLKEYVTSPFPWDIQGRKILLSSVVVPIIRNNQFLGIAGVDLPLNTIQDMTDKPNVYEDAGTLYIISYDGIVTGATGYPENIGKSLKESELPISSQADKIIADIQAGRKEVEEQNGMFIAYSPVVVGNSDQPWSVIFTVPVDVATAQARTNTLILIGIGSIFTIIGLLLLYLAAKGITRPIEVIARHADSIATGELGDEITIERRDEIGLLADSFRRMLESLQGKALAIDGIAEGNLSVAIPVVSDRDFLGKSMVKMRDTLATMSSTITLLAQKAILGQLETRGDLSLFHGAYRDMIAGINQTLDAVILPINESMKLAGRYASGDYTCRFDESLLVSGAFAAFRDALNTIGEENSKSVRSVKNLIDSVAASIEETNASVEEVSASSAKLAQSSQEVSRLAETSLSGVHQILRAMDDLSVNIAHVAEMTEKVASLSHATNELSAHGSEMAHRAEEGMRSIIRSIDHSEQAITEMSVQMNEIDQIIKLISDIADQTNLLALNAAIEAARAGESGRGFAVVADEVKSLAIESQRSAEKIGAMILQLQKQSVDATQAMKVSATEVATGNTAVNQTLEIFSRIVSNIQNISENTSAVASAAEEQAAAVEEITANVHELETHLTRTSEEAVSSAAATEETSAALDQISHSVADIAQATELLSKDVARFIV